MIAWDEALKAAARMGIQPEQFWRMSLKEWRLMAGRGEAMAANELAALAAKFPDGGQNGAK